MKNQLLVLAHYDNFLQAIQDAQSLKSEGIPCIVESFNPVKANGFFLNRIREIQLKVSKDDKDLAALALDLDDSRIENPTFTQLSQQYFIVAFITLIIGLCSAVGLYTGFLSMWTWIPIAFLLMGGLLFRRGMNYRSRKK